MTENAILSGVGLTAVTMAQERRVESRREDRLFDDPLADRFISAIVDSAAAGHGRSELELVLPGLTGDVTLGDIVPEFRGFVPLRTRYFDDHVLSAVANGCRQVVILAAGLDARAFRLPLPAGSRVFELDLPDLMAFKAGVLAGYDAEPAGRRLPVPADLRDDFADPLRAAGFEPGEPAVWLVEGLLPYLTVDDADRLLSRVGRLSASGSLLVVDQLSSRIWQLAGTRGDELSVLDKVGASWQSTIDNPTGWLAGKGWTAEVADMSAFATRHGREVPVLLDATSGPPATWLATAVREQAK
ncbi:class I SAM-dependent methyltransferase [Flindersiella endophytica]